MQFVTLLEGTGGQKHRRWRVTSGPDDGNARWQTLETEVRPKELVQAWVEAFNRAYVDALAAFYSETVVNHQVAENPVEGREAIRIVFESGFAKAEMVCLPAPAELHR